MANIEELQRALRQGSDAKARLSGLDEQYQQAQDRGVATTKKDQYGQVSPLSVMADVVGQSRSRRDMRELAPQREAARSNIAQYENAQGLFNAVRQQEQDNQIQANWTDGHALKLAQQSQNEAREVSRQGELADKLDLESQVGNPTTVWDIETGARQDVTFDPQGNPFTLTTQGLQEPFDMTGFSITKPEKATKNSKYGGLTPNALQTGLKEYRKALNPLAPIIQGVNNLNSMLSKLPDANKDIPGIGRLEGGSTWGAQLLRAAGSQEGENIHAAWTQTIAPLIREQAGLAQTQTELKRVEQAYGADWLSNEETFRTAYPEIMKALETDLNIIEGTFMKPVGNYYKDTMAEIGAPTIFDQAKFKDPFTTTDTAAQLKTGDMTREQMEAELAND